MEAPDVTSARPTGCTRLTPGVRPRLTLCPTRPRLSRRYSTMVVASLSFIVPDVRGVPRARAVRDDAAGPGLRHPRRVRRHPDVHVRQGRQDLPDRRAPSTSRPSRSPGPSRTCRWPSAVEAYFDRDTAVVPHVVHLPRRESAEQSKAEGAGPARQLQGHLARRRPARRRLHGARGARRSTGVVEGGAAKGKLRERRPRSAPSTAARSPPPEAVVEAVGTRKPGDDGHDRVHPRRRGRGASTSPPRPDAEGRQAAAHRRRCSRSKFDFPIKINNNVGDQVGGPSAGTMFALAIYDRLTPGALTGGQNDGRHRQIDADGTVGPIGGIRQKMAGAADGRGRRSSSSRPPTAPRRPTATTTA